MKQDIGARADRLGGATAIDRFAREDSKARAAVSSNVAEAELEALVGREL